MIPKSTKPKKINSNKNKKQRNVPKNKAIFSLFLYSHYFLKMYGKPFRFEKQDTRVPNNVNE